MDYKKRYEEALERAKAEKPMDEVFPELADGKNERIGNLIFCIVRDREDVRNTLEANGVSVDDALAYLERQKEQKPVHTAKEMWKEMRLEVYAQASGNRHEPNYSDDSTKMFSLCDIDEIFEKIGNSTVGSQPAEWSEEDEEMLDAMIDIVSNSLYEPLCPREGMLVWLKSLPERFNLQPKQEWSKEDESCWNLIWDILDGQFTASKEGYKKAAAWFLKNCPKGTKSLRPQPKNELSEKDKEKFIIDYLVSLGYPIDANGNIPNYNQTFESCKSALVYWLQQNLQKMLANKRIEPEGIRTETLLKDSYIQAYREGIEDSIRELSSQCENSSPQPHWKPSEEQMDALETAVSSLLSSALESLYNKLNKL